MLGLAWSSCDPTIFASLSYDGRVREQFSWTWCWKF